jgi:alkylhydroperoxidase/carboxymuconolactone decarboxylase family protein YurZ
VTYHLHQCRNADVTDEELTETLGVGLIVGGSIVIPHLRRAYAAWDELKK